MCHLILPFTPPTNILGEELWLSHMAAHTVAVRISSQQSIILISDETFLC